MSVDAHVEGCDLSEMSLFDFRAAASVHEACGQRPQDINNPVSRRLGDEFREARPHAVERGYGAKKGEEGFGAHDLEHGNRTVSIAEHGRALTLGQAALGHGSNRQVDAMLDDRRKRIQFRAWRRGFKEADILLGGFADAHLAQLGSAEVEAFEALLDQSDHDVYAWVTGVKEPPEAFRGALMDSMRAFAASPSPKHAR